MYFQILKKDSATHGRLGLLKTPHGSIETPFFMPVGTNATVRGISSEELHDMESQIVLSNTYHVYLRPGTEIIKCVGGLHQFMNWQKPILTDSGGYQVFSLTKFCKIEDDGVLFKSHLDGSAHRFTPEDVVAIEHILGSDIMMPLDVCAPYPCDQQVAGNSVDRTTAWAQRSRRYFQEHIESEQRQRLFGIIQGATFEDLRKRSAAEIVAVGFDGYAIGGVSVGEPVPEMFATVDWVVPMLPEDAPRYLMGIGLPDQIVKAVGEGIDMFDTCIPTRYGRHGTAFTWEGRMILLNAEFADDARPIDETCPCPTCQNYSRSYLRHLFKAGEMLGLRLVSLHNLFFYNHLLKEIRQAMKESSFDRYQRKFLRRYRSNLSATGGEDAAV